MPKVIFERKRASKDTISNCILKCHKGGHQNIIRLLSKLQPGLSLFAFEEKDSRCVEEDLKSISPTFYKQLLHVKIPKAQKDIEDLNVFWNPRS